MEIRIGRYGVVFGRTFWVQTKCPTQIWHWFVFWLFREASTSDVDKKPRFPVGTKFRNQEGRPFRYIRAGQAIQANTAVYPISEREQQMEQEKTQDKEGGCG